MAIDVIEPDIEFVKEIQRFGGDSVKACFQCAICSTTCPISPDKDPFPRKEMFWATWGLKNKLIKNPDIWLCYQCNDCSDMCPRGARPGDVLALARSHAFRHYAFPKIFGTMLGSAKYLPLLLAIPVVLFLIGLGATGHLAIPEGRIVYARFFPHHLVDPIFIAISILALIFAAVGLSKFWKDISAFGSRKTETEPKSLITALISAIIEVLTHKKFTECDSAKPRYLGHLTLFYGFIALLATTTLVFFGLYFTDGLELPMSLGHPIKILGNLGAILFIIGCGLVLYRRIADPDKAGKSGYTDWIFILDLLLIGITGVLCEVFRLTNLPLIAYPTYFLHLVLVFFLIAYFPFSKFSHFLYRIAAVTHCNMTGRQKR